MSLISIIIPVHPAHNRNDILGACLKSIDDQTYSHDKIELILLGDGCDIKTDFIPKGIKTTIRNFKNHVGVVKTRNEGIVLSKGDFCAFLDADCIARENWLETLVSGFKSEDIGGCGGRISNFKNECMNKPNLYGAVVTLPFTALGNAIFRREVLKEIGFLDNQLSIYAEDVDLSWRLYLKGHRIEYVPEAEVVHKGTVDAKDLFLYGKAKRDVARKYKKVFNTSSVMQFRLYRREVFQFGKVLIILYGYIHEFLKEKLHLLEDLEYIELTDKFLQPASSIRPLKVTIGSKTLIKPNHIIWWKLENGCKLADLKIQKAYILEDVSAKIWIHIMNRESKDIVIEKLLDEYDVDKEKLENDFEELIEDLYKEEILSHF